MEFRTRLLATLRAIAPILDQPGVLVVGSEVPNLLEPDAASTLVISQDVDLAIPIAGHSDFKARLTRVEGLRPSAEEPSVWVPTDPMLIEVNFLGLDPALSDIGETYVLEDRDLPLMVFGPLSLITPGQPARIGDLTVPLPRVAGLMLEKLVTDRSGVKGDRDLLVVLALLTLARAEDLDELESMYRRLSPEMRYAVRSNLSLLSLMEAHPGMPDPTSHRPLIARLLGRLERGEVST